MRNFDTSLPKIVELLERQLESLETEVEILQAAQELIPESSRPTRTQVLRMREGTLPLSRPAYLLGRLQRAIVAVENVASDLRTDLEHGFGEVEALDLVEADYNAIEAAVARLTPA